ncbi:amino acid permease [Verminephrobacter eiseniae]|uniref:Amino acid permease-associated region n=1 Tax=Verminephrobacter eiseniae (strain EF01-2) TaxID=391735 RepID=A1WIZ1_VEREI|nr:amino acid permease [Verminephrobacter eiseniae]ABM57598.1 amino acid permease-associated region [Verminephrobacter eiseniae EF01-2]MCW5283219.1 amino acid permease [Verminephrobacter eiseniae]MCW5303535.1 amino acid permease [Verminephrobacter eiseniae]MCW8178709.1 amino acid permease [Verminephrobacter eiseniae]MCW8188329.1 amino acid permease [Verminephrobacter eiseniae]
MNQPLDEDVKTLHSMGYAQELARRMSGFSNFAISFSIVCILAGGITSLPQALSTGFGFQVFVGWIVGGCFALVVALCLGQIGSAYPTAGGLYHWSSIFGGRGWGWATAWFNLIGLLFVVASVNVGVWYLFRDLVLAGVFHMDVSSITVDAARQDNGQAVAVQIFVVLLITTLQALSNHFGIKLTTMLTDFSGYLIFVVAIVLTGTFLIWGATWDFSRLFTFVNMTGEAGGGLVPQPRSMFIAFLIGLLYPLYTLTGFDASAHTAEETHNARVAVPRGMLHAVLWSVVFGLVMAGSFVLASPDLAATAKEGGSAWFNLFNNLPAPTWLKDFLAIAIVVANFICALAGLTSASRMIFAFARDGGLPGSRIWRHVSVRWRTPVAAIWLGAGCSVAATLYSPAFSALAAGCALFLYVSYAMPIAAGFFAEGKSWTEFGPFRLGFWSKPLAALSSAGVLVLVYAGIQPPSDILINYIIGIVVFLTVLWFGVARRRFKGPPIGAEITRRAHEIEAAEEAVGEVASPGR